MNTEIFIGSPLKDENPHTAISKTTKQMNGCTVVLHFAATDNKADIHMQKLTNYIRYWQASGESVKTSIRTKTRLGQIVQEGRFRGGGVPYGYRIERQGRLNKKNHEVYELLVEEHEAGVVQAIFDMYVNKGYGTQTLATRLTEQGIKNRSGNIFHPSTILNMLKN